MRNSDCPSDRTVDRRAGNSGDKVAYSAEAGQIGWIDLTVADAKGVADFYAHVAGWLPDPVDTGDHVDYNMLTGEARDVVAGVCHALGQNAGLPPQWLVYANVPDLDVATAEIGERGGGIIVGPIGEQPEMRFVVARDPAGAAFALVEHGMQGAMEQQ